MSKEEESGTEKIKQTKKIEVKKKKRREVLHFLGSEFLSGSGYDCGVTFTQ